MQGTHPLFNVGVKLSNHVVLANRAPVHILRSNQRRSPMQRKYILHLSFFPVNFDSFADMVTITNIDGILQHQSITA